MAVSMPKAVLALCVLAVAGCQQAASDLSSADDKAMRGKIDQGLSPAEIEKHFGKDFMKKNATGAPEAPAKQPQ